MSDTEKVALIAAVFNVVLTVLKAVAYVLTGSLAILAEAWHSLTDILTSVFVFLSITDDGDASSAQHVDVEDETKSSKQRSLIRRFTVEHWVALGIGIFLFLVAGGLVYEALAGVAREIQYPLMTGIIFIFFSAGNYAVYRFEIAQGEDLRSVGLISDGMHSKADMATDLLVGFSLVLYELGIQNLDRFTALFVTVFIFSYSIETIVNVIRSTFRDSTDEILFQDTASEILSEIFSAEFWRDIIGWIRRKFPSQFVKSQFIRDFITYAGYAVIGLVVAGIGWTFFFQVEAGERAILERFGVPVSKRTLKPGLHLKYPYPIDTVVKYPVERIHSVSVGNRVKTDAKALLWTREHGIGDPFLAGDNLFFFPYFEVQFKIRNFFDFHYNHRNPIDLIKNLTYQICTDLFVRRPFFKLATQFRGDMGEKIESKLATDLKKRRVGIDVVSVNLYDIHPPIPVSNAYEDVVEAIQAKEETIEKGYRYRNRLIPSAKATADSIVSDAQKYYTRETIQSRGEAKRFTMKAKSASYNREITFQRLYLDTLTQGLKETNKIIVDPRTGVPEVWLGLEGPTLRSLLQQELDR